MAIEIPQITSTPKPLTPKEKRVLEFIEQFVSVRGVAPSFQEVKDHFGFASFNSVQRYLKQLQTKNYLYMPGGNQKRAITLLNSSSALQSSLQNNSLSRSGDTGSGNFNPFVPEAPQDIPPPPAESLSLPLCGKVAAGQPLEAFEYNEFVDVPTSLVRNPSKSFALTVQGQSMIEDGILNGDTIIVQRQDFANNGEIVVAMVDNEATVKRFYLHSNRVELRPANSQMESMWFASENVKIQGVVVSLLRSFT